jgi:hypothetical protein
MQNFDLALSKSVPLSESYTLLFRIEAFNAFNHAQFFGPNTVNSILPAGLTFGQITLADRHPSRKLLFVLLSNRRQDLA